MSKPDKGKIVRQQAKNLRNSYKGKDMPDHVKDQLARLEEAAAWEDIVRDES